MLNFAVEYNKRVQAEETSTPEEIAIANVGKADPKRHLEEDVEKLMGTNIDQAMSAAVDSIIF